MRSRPVFCLFACMFFSAWAVFACSKLAAQTSRVPSYAQTAIPNPDKSSLLFKYDLNGTTKSQPWKPSPFFPTLHDDPGCANDNDCKDKEINAFFGTANSLSYFGQIKSIYNGASGSATLSSDIASLDFRAGFQVTVGTNIQAGSSGTTSVTTGTIPTLSSASAGQATQNMLYGGTLYASALLPVLSVGAGTITKAGNLGASLNLVGREGVDIQNFKAGTSTTASAPPSHTSVQMEGYLQYNSINLAPNQKDLAGAVFIGGSYGYSYTSHGYARDYGFGNNVNNGIGQVSVGILANGVLNIVLSRAFGPSQTYIDSTSMVQTTANTFKAWSFGISYQSPPAK